MDDVDIGVLGHFALFLVSQLSTLYCSLAGPELNGWSFDDALRKNAVYVLDGAILILLRFNVTMELLCYDLNFLDACLHFVVGGV